MKSFSKVALAASLASTGIASGAYAATFSDNFSNLGTQGSPDASGYYYFMGDQASQNFSGTGLSSVSSFGITLSAGGSNNYASEPLELTFSINGVDVGATTFNPGEMLPRALSFSFAPIAGLGTDYLLRAYVTQPVCAGCGAVQIGTDNPFTLNGAGGVVPEPATWSLLILGFGLIGAAMRIGRNKPLSVIYQ